jgi:hypothetical protein
MRFVSSFVSVDFSDYSEELPVAKSIIWACVPVSRVGEYFSEVEERRLKAKQHEEPHCSRTFSENIAVGDRERRMTSRKEAPPGRGGTVTGDSRNWFQKRNGLVLTRRDRPPHTGIALKSGFSRRQTEPMLPQTRVSGVCYDRWPEEYHVSPHEMPRHIRLSPTLDGVIYIDEAASGRRPWVALHSALTISRGETNKHLRGSAPERPRRGPHGVVALNAPIDSHKNCSIHTHHPFRFLESRNQIFADM